MKSEVELSEEEIDDEELRMSQEIRQILIEFSERTGMRIKDIALGFTVNLGRFDVDSEEDIFACGAQVRLRDEISDEDGCSIEIKHSKYTDGVNGSMNCFCTGDKARFQSSSGESFDVVIDSEIMIHDDAPKDGKVIEVVFSDGSGRFAVSAHRLFPIFQE